MYKGKIQNDSVQSEDGRPLNPNYMASGLSPAAAPGILPMEFLQHQQVQLENYWPQENCKVPPSCALDTVRIFRNGNSESL